MSERRDNDAERFEELLEQWMREEAPAGAPEEILDNVRSSARTTPQRPRLLGWYPVLGLAAATAVAAILLFIGLWTDVGQDEPEETAPPTPSAIASTPDATSSAPPASASPSTRAETEPWTRAEVALPAENSSRMAAAASGVGGLVAVGGGGSVEGFGGVLAWHSSDGESWTLTLDAHAEQDASQMLDVVATDAGYVGVGNNFPGVPVWLSTDGLSWREAGAASAPSGQSHALEDIAWSGDELVAIGFASENDRQLATVWRSNDGEAWTRLDVPDAFAASRPVDVAMGVDGTAVIITVREPDFREPVAWQVRDDAVGDPIPLPGEDAELSATAVVATANGFTAVGQSWDPDQMAYRVLAWDSADGRTWIPIETEAVGSPFGAAHVDGRGVVAVGATIGLEDSEVTAWQSSEGGAWRTVVVERSNGAAYAALERADGRLLIVGADDPDGAATVWLEP
jgi:hypothetical protein